MNDNTQLVRLTPETELYAQQIPHEAAVVVEDTTPKPNRAETTDREYLLKMALEVYRMKRYEPVIYIVAVFVAISTIITPLAVMRYLPSPGRTTSIITVSSGMSSITANGDGYTVIVTSDDGVIVSRITASGRPSTDIQQKNAEQKAQQERKAAEREAKRKAKEARRLEKQAAKLERQAERLRLKAERLK